LRRARRGIASAPLEHRRQREQAEFAATGEARFP
jgi:hypothetical protein